MVLGGSEKKKKKKRLEHKHSPPHSPPTPPQSTQEEDVLGKQPGADPGAMTPLGDRVLLRAVEAKRETDGGVILASDSDVERPTLGEVSGGGGGGGGGGEKGAPSGRVTKAFHGCLKVI